jgi:hypothetical protein
MSTLYVVQFLKSYAPNQGAAYAVGEQAAFALADAVRLVGEGVAEFSDPSDLTANQSAVTAATPTPLIAVDTFIQTTNDGSDPQVVLQRRA